MIKIIRNFFTPTIKDPIGEDLNLYDTILYLHERIEKLEEENVELTNCLYEIENRLECCEFQQTGTMLLPVHSNLTSKSLA
jgi:hypothetical protein